MPRRPASPPAAACSGRVPDATRQRLLDAAERLFAERGFEGTSMRALAELAGTSVSAGHYHFGGKLELVRAVLLRRIEPMNARRLELLTALEQRAQPRRPDLEGLLEAFLRPSLEAWRGWDEQGEARTRHVLAQLHADPDPSLVELKVELFGPVVERFLDAMGDSLPDRSRAEIALDLQFIVGMLVQVVGGQLQARLPAGAGADPRAGEELLLRRMIDFAAAGLRAKTLAAALPRAGAEDME